MITEHEALSDAEAISAGYDWLCKNSTVTLGLSTIAGLVKVVNDAALAKRQAGGEFAPADLMKMVYDIRKRAEEYGRASNYQTLDSTTMLNDLNTACGQLHITLNKFARQSQPQPAPASLDNALAEFVAAQTQLSPEMRDAVYNNLWDLYEGEKVKPASEPVQHNAEPVAWQFRMRENVDPWRGEWSDCSEHDYRQFSALDDYETRALCVAPTPATQPAEVERDAAIEKRAKEIYESWCTKLGYVPWVDFGNSDKQCVARFEARAEAALAAHQASQS